MKDILNLCSVLFLTPEVLSTLNCLLHSHSSCWNCFNRAHTCTLGPQLHKDQAFPSPHFSKFLRMGNYVFLKTFKGLLWWLSGNESTCQCRTQVWSLIQEDPTCHGATKPVCHNYAPCASSLGTPPAEPSCRNYWRPCTLETAHCNRRSHSNKKPIQCSQRKVCKQWRPSTAINK